MSSEVITIDNYESIFEDQSHSNGFLFWYARDLMATLGYKDYNTFKKSINKSIGICASLNIDVADNFISIKRVIEDKEVDDYKLSRFACYLVAMNSDIKKQEVAKAQAYLAKCAEIIVTLYQEAQNIERIELREKLREDEKNLSGIAKAHKVENYALFQNAGYLGLYNMSLKQLNKMKGIPKNKVLLDYMNSTELGANIFRITQTAEKIKSENIQGQYNLEKAHKEVGKEVRNSMKRMHNRLPEDLPLEEDIKKVKSNLKETHKKMKKISKKTNG